MVGRRLAKVGAIVLARSFRRGIKRRRMLILAGPQRFNNKLCGVATKTRSGHTYGGRYEGRYRWLTFPSPLRR